MVRRVNRDETAEALRHNDLAVAFGASLSELELEAEFGSFRVVEAPSIAEGLAHGAGLMGVAPLLVDGSVFSSVTLRTGPDLTVAVSKAMTAEVLHALEDADVAATVIECPGPLETILASVRLTGKLLIVQDAMEAAVGVELAAAVAENAFEHLDAAPVRLLQTRPVPDEITSAITTLCHY